MYHEADISAPTNILYRLDYSHPVETCKALDTFFQV